MNGKFLITVALFLFSLNSNANANFSFALETPVSTGYQFDYNWTGFTAGTPQYTIPPTYDFVSQEMDDVTGVVSLVNYDPTHFVIQLVFYTNYVDVLVEPTSVAYTSGVTEPLFSLVDNYSGTRMLPGSYILAGMMFSLPYPVEGPSGIGGLVPEPSSIILCLIGILCGATRWKLRSAG